MSGFAKNDAPAMAAGERIRRAHEWSRAESRLYDHALNPSSLVSRNMAHLQPGILNAPILVE
jgi:hypothetical protein